MKKEEAFNKAWNDLESWRIKQKLQYLNPKSVFEEAWNIQQNRIDHLESQLKEITLVNIGEDSAEAAVKMQLMALVALNKEPV